MSKLTALPALAFAAALGGCATSATSTGTFMAADNAPALAPRPAVTVDMYWGAPPIRPYRTLGQIILEPDRASGLVHTTRLEIDRTIRREGGHHGCDAVVVEPAQRGHSVWQQTASCLQYIPVATNAPDDPDLRGPSSARR